MLVGVCATTASWSKDLREYVRDHRAGIDTEVVLSAGQLDRTGRRRFDVLVVDDVSRLLGPADIDGLLADGTEVIGLFHPDPHAGGRGALECLGVRYDRVLPSAIRPSELSSLIESIGPVKATAVNGSAVRAAANLAVVPRRGGRLVVFSAVSGGSGLTEVVLAVGEALAVRCPTLVIEASPVGACLAVRTGGHPSRTLAWSLGRSAVGQRALPDGLTPPAESHSRLGRCDRICQTAAPGGPPLMSPEQLVGLVDEARDAYELVVVEIGPLISPLPGATGADRFAAGRAVLAGADIAVVFAGPDPESAVRMGEWRVTANEVGCRARCLGVFGRLPRRSGFQRRHLAVEVDRSTGATGFESFRCLPDDPRVARARWNGELVTAGPWLAEINAMATDLSGITPLRVARRRKEPDRSGPVWGQPSPGPRQVSLAEEAALVRSRAR
jgi:hypothetical protein